MLPFGQKSLPVELSQLRVAEPHRGYIRSRTACVGCGFQTDYTVFADIAFRAFDAEFV